MFVPTCNKNSCLVSYHPHGLYLFFVFATPGQKTQTRCDLCLFGLIRSVACPRVFEPLLDVCVMVPTKHDRVPSFCLSQRLRNGGSQHAVATNFAAFVCVTPTPIHYPTIHNNNVMSDNVTCYIFRFLQKELFKSISF